MKQSDCKKLPQKEDKYGDPINACNEGLDIFIEKWREHHPTDNNPDYKIRDYWYDDFKKTDNKTIEEYFKEIEQRQR
ncbi:MAG: hypothetical protein WC934_02000 [Acidithiobacillus sp.]|jgi:hypothetical protein|uniref:hypothetical protein n=1 Tax=Acidithiobacillus sp. TaxID=1872118 RepID=UPI00355D984C